MRLFLSAPLLATLLALVGNSFLFSSAKAGSTGLETIHTLVRHGNRLCMDGHFHYGSGKSQKSKALALADAKRKWANFVVVEYGTDWGRFSKAAAKGGRCYRTDTGYQCSVEASPCKVLYRARPIHHTARRHKRRHYRHRSPRRRYAKMTRHRKHR